MKANCSSASLLRACHRSHDRAIPPPDRDFGNWFALFASMRGTRLTARASVPPNANHLTDDAIVPETRLARENAPSQCSRAGSHGDMSCLGCRHIRGTALLVFGCDREQSSAERAPDRNEAKLACQHFTGRDCINCSSGDFCMHRVLASTCSGDSGRQNKGPHHLRGNGRIRRSRGRRRTAVTGWLGASSWQVTSTGDTRGEPRHTRYPAARSRDR